MAKRTLEVQLIGDTKSLSRALGKGGKDADVFGRRVSSAGKLAAKGLGLAGVAAGGALVVGLKKSVDAFMEAEAVAKQTETTLRSTGGAAKVTAGDISNLATAISRKSGMDDEAIQSAENLLLTFTKVRNETGAGNKIFTRATQTVADFSVTFKKDLAGSAILVGKALNDPVKGLSALSRVGVQFTAGQKKTITSLVESGHTLQAQKVILKELETQTKGSAAAYGETLAGKIGKAKTALGNLGEAVGGRVAPVIADAATAAADFVDNLATSDRPAELFGGVKDLASDARDALAHVFDDFKDRKAGGASFATALGGSLVGAVADIDWSSVGDTISSGFTSGVDFAGKIAPAVKDGVSAGIGLAVSEVDGEAVLGGLVDILGGAIEALFSPSFWKEHFGAIFSVVTILIPLGRILKIPGMEFLYQKISKPLFNIFMRAVKFAGSGFSAGFKAVAKAGGSGFVGGLISAAPHAVGAALRLAIKVTHAIGMLPGRLAGIGSRAGGSLAGGILDQAAKVGGAAGRLVGKVISAVGGGIGRIYKVGQDMVTGLIHGIGSMGAAVVKKITGLLGDAVDAAKGFLGIKSPSKVFHDMGLHVGQGLADGLRASASKVRSGVQSGLLFPLEGAIRDLEAKKEALQASFEAWDRRRERQGLVASIGTAREEDAKAARESAGGRVDAGLGWARSMVGKFKETGNNTGPGLDKLEREFGMHAAAWCAMFATKALIKAGAPKELKSASVAQLRGWAQAGTHGLQRGVRSTGRAGDLMAFGNRHIGVVESVDRKKGIVHTIEGNTSGGKVARRTHAIGSGDYFRPNYPGGGGAGGAKTKGKLSAAEVRGLAHQVGFRGEALDTMVAIVLAESGGRTGASHRNRNGTVDRGLAQINSVHGRMSTFDPLRNMQSAFSLYKGRHGFKDWATFNSGAYKRFSGKTGKGVGVMPGISGAVSGGDGGSVADAIKALKDFDNQTARTKRLSSLDIQIKGKQQVLDFTNAIKDLRSNIEDRLNAAVDKFRDNWESTTGKAIDAANAQMLKGFDATTEAIIAQTAAAQELAGLRSTDDALSRQKEDADNAKNLADAQWLVAHSGGKAHEEALQGLADAEAQIAATGRKRREDELEAQVAAETAAIQDQRAIERDALEEQLAANRQARMNADVAGFQNAEGAKLNVLASSLEAQRLTYAQFVKQVNALLAKLGIPGIDVDAGQEAIIAGGLPASSGRGSSRIGQKIRRRKRAVGGPISPGTIYRTGELGPEDIYMDRSGGVRVRQASESGRASGGGNVYMTGTVHIGSQKAARVMANRLAYRVAFG